MENRMAELQKLSTGALIAFFFTLTGIPPEYVKMSAIMRHLAGDLWEHIEMVVKYLNKLSVSKKVGYEDYEIFENIIKSSPRLGHTEGYLPLGIATDAWLTPYLRKMDNTSFENQIVTQDEEIVKRIERKRSELEKKLFTTLQVVLVCERLGNFLEVNQKLVEIGFSSSELKPPSIVIVSVDTKEMTLTTKDENSNIIFRWEHNAFTASKWPFAIKIERKSDFDISLENGLLGVPRLETLCGVIVWKNKQRYFQKEIPNHLSPPFCVRKIIDELDFLEKCASF